MVGVRECVFVEGVRYGRRGYVWYVMMGGLQYR